ncbi:hypothetical protein [Alicyclobacillus mengziensis]|uniref:WD40 repeat protein n=1 Tax=Alicyclobacillus mengziensis TaxID=2931921 RepID=A0A9X7VY80_9BACL|nr:hypothetical protein [Alicyclobacillus mengziensis]QSO46800.1 hypothetical protein JZ786_20560 [Alicyclobacillus mengziensis]
MRASISAAFVGCTCAMLLLGGCGSPSIQGSADRTQAGSASNHTSERQGGSSQPSSGPSASGPSASGGATSGQAAAEQTLGSKQSSVSSDHPRVKTKVGEGASAATRSTENFIPVSSGSKSNQMQAKFAPSAWKQGEAALLVNPPNSYGLNGSLLYVLVDSSSSGTGHAQARLVDEHAISAGFSPNGKWLAVQTQANQGSVSQPIENSQLWLMSVDGKQKYDLGSVSYVQGIWIGPETFMYTDGTSHVYSVQPGGEPSTLPLQLPAGVTVNALSMNPKTKMVAIDEVVPDANGNVVNRHDVIGIWNPATGRVNNVLTAPTSDGFILGPWTADGTRLFYWPDPFHSASIAADGLQLHILSMDGATQGVAVTLTGQDPIKPVGGSSAILQVGGSRYLFVKKTIELWNGRKLIPLPGSSTGNLSGGAQASTGATQGQGSDGQGAAQGQGSDGQGVAQGQGSDGQGVAQGQGSTGATQSDQRTSTAGSAQAQMTQVWPTVNPNGTMVAYSQGPVLSMNAGQPDISQWWEHMQLVTMNLKTGARNVLSRAGLGVVDPEFTSNGQFITYVSGTQLDVVSVNDSAGKQVVFEVTPTNATLDEQWSLSLPVEVVDYHP